MSQPKKTAFAAALATAANTLLCGESSAAGFSLLDDDKWQTSAMLLYYSEGDRVSAVEPVIQVVRTIDTDESVTLKLTFDSLTGASGSGAIPGSQPVVYTRPSGNGVYSVPAGEVPLDDTFLDTRAALSASWLQPVGDFRLTLGGNLSREYDYRSFSLNSILELDTNLANTTYSAGISVAADTISPVGGAPIPHTAMRPPDTTKAVQSTEEDKTVVDLLVGVTQIIDQNSLVQLTAGFSTVDGYQTDPYKVISIVDENGELVSAANATGLPSAVFEHRPDTRQKQSLYLQYKRNFNGKVMDTAYRYTTDDWGIDSHTIELSLRFPLPNQFWIQPRARWYSQSAADFYTPYFIDGTQPVVGSNDTHSSADYRLNNMQTLTVGLEVGRSTRRNWSAAIEYYLQQPREPNKIGTLNNYTLTPDVDALLVRFGFSF